MSDNKESKDIAPVEAPIPPTAEKWINPPKLAELKADYDEAQSSHTSHTLQVQEWLDNLDGKQKLKIKKGRSKVVPKLIRKQAEWRYSSLSEPFLSTEDLFKTSPKTHLDKRAAIQNGLILNHQFNTQIDKVAFIDEYVRTAVDEGTVVVKVGWDFQEENRPEEVDVYEDEDGNQYDEPVGIKLVDYFVTIRNQPTLEICDYKHLVIDPTCNGDIEKAGFVIYGFETSLSELKKDGRYYNLDKIDSRVGSVLSRPDNEVDEETNFEFKDKPRRKFFVYEYWGYWDIDDTGETKPFLATWCGDTIIRLEESPFPDKKIPFVLVQYLPKRKTNYGEPDGSLIEDNQRVVGAVTRGVLDILGRSANGQVGSRKDALDLVNFRKFERGDDYKFNANINPDQAFHMGKYPEIPQSAITVLSMQHGEAESLTGVKAFGTEGITGQALGSTATGIKSVVNSTAKREVGILRRLANGITKIGRKITAMNGEFLDETEVVRITDDEFVPIKRDDLDGDFDVKLSIATAEEDEARAQELAFMLQTVGNNAPPGLSQMVFAEIARLRKMPVFAKALEEYQPQPDPAQQRINELQIQLLEAQVANEQAKAIENQVDQGLKTAKTETEQAKARKLHSEADKDDLDFVETETGVKRQHEENMADKKHASKMQEKEHDRLSKLDEKAIDDIGSEKQDAQPVQ